MRELTHKRVAGTGITQFIIIILGRYYAVFDLRECLLGACTYLGE